MKKKISAVICTLMLVIGFTTFAQAGANMTSRGIASDGYGGAIAHTAATTTSGGGTAAVGINYKTSSGYYFGYASTSTSGKKLYATKGYGASPGNCKTYHNAY